MLFTFIFLGAHWSASAQVYVHVRPIAPVVVQTTRPGPTHVWIGEEWDENGTGYRYSGGHWAVPPHPGDTYRQGHWNHDSHGDHWERGGWGGKKK